MIKICGVTFDHTTNYGSCFQAYALGQTISNQMLDTEQCSYELLPYYLWNKKENNQKPGSLSSRIKNLISRAIENIRRKQFIKFEKNYINYANLSGIKDLSELDEKYDAFVCGSDVIWSFDFTKGDPVYFLSFARKYKFSYAASFGVKNIFKDYEQDEDVVRNLFSGYLPTLNSISLREKSAVEQVKTITDKPCRVVCDPVFLLTANEWSRIYGDDKETVSDKYIFVYSTYISPNLLNFVEKLHSQTGLRVIHVTWDKKEAIKHRLFVYPTPEQWLFLLKNAAYVVTNSFHATAFCLLFHKIFYWVMKNQNVEGTGIRLFDLLESVGLKERIYNYTPEDINLNTSDFTYADKVIKAKREEGLNFIRENLTAAKRIRDGASANF